MRSASTLKGLRLRWWRAPSRSCIRAGHGCGGDDVGAAADARATTGALGGAGGGDGGVRCGDHLKFQTNSALINSLSRSKFIFIDD